ncbi:ABC transporter permease [Carboxylicivirga sp. RSCT41]|uniref:ABC transporter permease n=1 Tax=Carboxylicivirga agarovorans TaxID=3417570 RepID=UPI003D33C0FF
MNHFTNFTLVIRSLLKNKVVSVLNIAGLTIGLSLSLFIFIFVINQKSIDQFFPQVEDIYCVTINGSTYLSQSKINLVKDEIPDLEKLTYVSEDWSPQIFLKTNEQSWHIEKMLTADSCFFRVFGFETLYGDPSKAFGGKNKLVITRSLSEKIFGDENPVGQSVTYNATYLQGELLEIVGVIENLPNNSAWDFEAVLSFETNYHIDWYVNNMKSWGTNNYKAFVRLESINEQQALTQLSNISLDKVPEGYKEDFKLSLFKYEDVYFDLHELSFLKHGNRLTVTIIGVLGFLVLLLACINYINMVTAQREKRFRNMGIVKILGAGYQKIIQMVTIESLIQVAVAFILTLLIVIQLLPVFNQLTSLNYSIVDVFSFKHIALMLGVAIVMVMVTGILPGVLFGLKVPLSLIKKTNKRNDKQYLRNGLLIFQFTVTIALIASIIMINKQTRYMQQQNLGFDKECVIYANTNAAIYDRIDAFKDALNQIPGVAEFTVAENVIVDNGENWGRDILIKGKREDIHFSKLSVAPNFFDFFNINLLEGRTFNENSRKNQEFIFNKAATLEFGIDDIREAQMACAKPEQGQVVGVIENYNFESLHVPIRSAAYMCSDDCDEVIYMKLINSKDETVKQTMLAIDKAWNEVSPDFPFEYHFLDVRWEEYYHKDKQFQTIISFTTFISIFLSCLGLIGLTFFVIESRIKEIGVRKVNGANVSEILTLLNKDFVRLVIVAFIIACPIAWLTMHQWLNNFAYKADLSWWVFALAGISAMAIALITVSWQSWRAARRNPVEALRYE